MRVIARLLSLPALLDDRLVTLSCIVKLITGEYELKAYYRRSLPATEFAELAKAAAE